VNQLPTGDQRLLDSHDADDRNFAGQVRVKLKDPDTGSFFTDPAHPDGLFPLSPDGIFNISGLTLNKEYELALVFMVTDAENHGPVKEIIVNTLDNSGTLPRVKVSSDGELNILDELIDPYGDITDTKTHAAVDGATVELYYANTLRNTGAGITPNTIVHLP